MYLLFSAELRDISFATFTSDGELLYEDSFALPPKRDGRQFHHLFDEKVVTRLRSHGRVFKAVGIVLPFAPKKWSRPCRANKKVLEGLETSQLRKSLLHPSKMVFDRIMHHWPHLDHWFLTDSCLSAELERHTVLPPFGPALNEQFNLESLILYSYAHKAAMLDNSPGKSAISLALYEGLSLARLEGRKIVQADYVFSPTLPGLGPWQSGQLEAGLVAELAEKFRPADLADLLLTKTGIHNVAGQEESLDVLLEIAGLVPHKDTSHLDRYSIETIELIEITMRQFILYLKQKLGSYLSADIEAKTVLVSTNKVSVSSKLWPLLTSGSLSHVKIKYVSKSPLQLACLDLLD